MNPQNIMLSKRSQTYESMHYMIPFILSSRTKVIHGSKSQNSGYLKGELSGVTDMFYILIWMVVTQVHIFVKINWAIHVRFVHFSMYKLYLQKNCSNWYNLSGVLSGNVCQKHPQTTDSEITLLGIYPKKIIKQMYKDTCMRISNNLIIIIA